MKKIFTFEEKETLEVKLNAMIAEIKKDVKTKNDQTTKQLNEYKSKNDQMNRELNEKMDKLLGFMQQLLEDKQ